jgi:site-specific DNA recombinase
MAAVCEEKRGAVPAAAAGGLVAWAEESGRRQAGGPARGGLRFVFYGRVSTEDWQDPVTSRARQREQAEALVRGHGVIVAEFFDAGQSRTVAWGRRPKAAALVALLADPDRGWDAIVVGEYERAFYGSQYAAMAPLFEHYGVQLWMPEAGGRVDYASEHDEQTMTYLGLSSKREVTRTSIRVRTAMAVQVRDQGRYLGGRLPYGYRLGDAGPHPNKAHAAWGRRARRLEPDPETAHIVRWIFARRLAGHSMARIARALNDAGIPCPSAADPGRNPHRTGAGWTLGTVATILSNPRYTGRQVWNRQRTDRELADPADVSLGHKSVQRWNLPDGWVISRKRAHPQLVSEADFIAAENVSAARGPAPARAWLRRHHGGTCWPGCWYAAGAGGGWNQHGPTASLPTGAATATPPPARVIRIGPGTRMSVRTGSCRTLPALHPQLTEPATPQRRRRTRRGLDTRHQVCAEDVISYLRERRITLTYVPASGALSAGTAGTAQAVTLTGS